VIIALSSNFNFAVVATEGGSAGLVFWAKCLCGDHDRHRDELDDRIASIQERVPGVRVLSGR
jgi:hypothetical protein